MDFIYKKSGPIFNAHSYWTKQPVDAISYFLNQYTKKGDVVLDPFCGTGMTGVACIQNNRDYILSDISYTCLHISRGYCTQYDRSDVEIKLNKLIKGLNEDFYNTKCPICGKKAKINYEVLVDKLEEKNHLEIDHIIFNCECGQKSGIKSPDSHDYEILNREDFKKFFYPMNGFFGEEPKRNFKRGIYKVYQLYSPRNMSALASLWDRISNLEENNFKTLCEFAFTAILFNCSLLSRYSERYKNTKIRSGTYYIPYLIKDNNVIDSFVRKIRSIIKSSNEIFKNIEASQKSCGIIRYDDATELTSVKDSSIDYIYTDPPYSDLINYAELNIVWESWLQQYTDTNKEMIVSKAEKKELSDYSRMFSRFMDNAYRVLKNNKYITIIFHNAKLADWKAFQKALCSTNLIPVINEKPIRLISNSRTNSQHETNKLSQCFLAFTLQKVEGKTPLNLIDLDDEEYSKKIECYKKMAVEEGYTSHTDIYDYVINKLIFSYWIKDYIKL